MNRRELLRSAVLATGAVTLGSALPGGIISAAPVQAGGATASSTGATYVLPPLGYAFDALEPYIDKATMEIHYGKHHAAYVAALNKAVAGQAALKGKSAEELLVGLDQVPEEIRTTVRNNAGGHVNHSFFWKSLKKNDSGSAAAPAAGSALAKAIADTFGDHAKFYEAFDKAATGVFGSGWAWLVVKADKALAIVSTPNQDNPIMNGHKPLLGLDVWEHAYYLKHQNKRKDYVDAFANVIDWDAVDKRYELAVS
ncbi:superoxide dismutase [Verrucomicrobia bacterium LW23]|nr:superoxide dismutase [Verrucomicrobia bacterium LW23]